MKRFSIIILLVFALFLSLNSSGCSVEESADTKQKRATEESLKEAHAQAGMPAIHNWTEKKLVKMLYEIRDKADLVCYAYIVTMNGTKIFLGKCIGYGVPYSIQYSNPVNGNFDYGKPQAEPNGLFMPEGLSATWLMLLDKKGVAKPVYVENEVIVSPFPLF